MGLRTLSWPDGRISKVICNDWVDIAGFFGVGLGGVHAGNGGTSVGLGRGACYIGGSDLPSCADLCCVR
jgi:hypothetical protein